MQIKIGVIGFIFLIPSAVLSRPFPVDSLYEVLPERSLSSHNGMNLGSGISDILADTSNIMSDSLKFSNQSESNRRHIEPFPILSYDTDTKLGYGAKLFLFDLLKLHESFDMVLFNSTNGEKWYHFVFSIPDFELREGTEYPFAIDFIFDYDKWLRDNFYAIGNRSVVSDVEHYTRIPMNIEIDFNRGFSSTFVGQLKIRTMSVENNNFATDSRLAGLSPSLNSGTVTFTSFGLTVRYDTRNSYINASSGLVLQGESEFSPEWELGNTNFTRFTGWIQYYLTLFSPMTVLAWRVGLQQVMGNDIPVQVMSSLGGTGTLRGYPQDRFLDEADMLFNVELRFPIFWRFGGVVGLDAGKVWPSLAVMDLQRWAYNPMTGLRFYMDNFVVRADIGFGSEGTGFYFNFGQLF